MNAAEWVSLIASAAATVTALWNIRSTVKKDALEEQKIEIQKLSSKADERDRLMSQYFNQNTELFDENAALRTELSQIRKELTETRELLEKERIENGALKLHLQKIETTNRSLQRKIGELTEKVRSSKMPSEKALRMMRSIAPKVQTLAHLESNDELAQVVQDLERTVQAIIALMELGE